MTLESETRFFQPFRTLLDNSNAGHYIYNNYQNMYLV